MKIKAVRKNKWYNNQDYITLGKEYEALCYRKGYAEFCDDVGALVCVILKDSSHGFDFEVVQEEGQQKPFKFKVGDKVKVTGGQHTGTEGTLIKHRFEEYPWFELEGTGLGVAVDNLALLQSVDPMPIVEPEEDLMETTESNFSLDYQIKSDGGPSSYYDFPSGKDAWVTLNDMNDYKSVHQWGPLSFHMTNVNKATFRFGQKDGTSKVYDINKIIYSGLRMKLMLEDKEAVRKYLQQLLDDPQFQENTP